MKCEALIACGLLLLSAAGDTAAVIGGAPEGSPADSPENRIDPNTTTSPWAGVGALTVFRPGTDTVSGSYTAAAIDPWHVLTAAHVVAGKAAQDVRFNLNYGSDLSHRLRARAIFVHPDYAGFVPDPVSGVVHDDLAIVRLESPVPFGVPLYGIRAGPVPLRSTLAFVGYGAGGDGIRGASVAGSPTIKRVGRNSLDRVFLDNGGSGAVEVYLFDFDGPDAATNRMGGLSLGNAIEATVAGGDSGAPSFVPGPGGAWLIAGVNTFVAPAGPAREKFGGLGGGILLQSYTGWIESVLGAMPPVAPSVAQ